MTARQMRLPVLVLSGFAALSGLSLLAPGVQPSLAWPGLALMAGVLAGVLAFADEQISGSARFWGEQRLPVGRAWLVKIGLHLLLCLWLLLLLALPLVIRAQAGGREHDLARSYGGPGRVFRSLLLTELGGQGWKFLLAPAAYGFAAGHLCGLLFRKLVVACGVAGILGGVGAAMWAPSLLSGGVKHWQVWLAPAVVLATARVLLPAWAAGRLVARGPLAALAGGCAAAVLVTAAGLAYRVLEVPTHPDSEADVAHVAALIPFDANAAGRDFRTASERYARALTTASAAYDRKPPPPGTTRRPARAEERLEVVVRTGWPADDPAFAEFLDDLFAAPPDEEAWHVTAEKAGAHPVGVFEYPQAIRLFGTRDVSLQNAHRMALTLLVRGLQKQAEGDPAALVAALRTTLALTRTMRNASTVASYLAGSDLERIALLFVDRWLDVPPASLWLRVVLAPVPGTTGAAAAAGVWAGRADPTPELLRAAVEALEGADPDGPFDPTPHYLAERYAIRETLRGPSQWLPAALAPPGKNPDSPNAEVDLVTFAWAVPWERERTRRLVGLGFEAGRPADFGLIAGRPGAPILARPRVPSDLPETERTVRALRRATTLKLALRAYRADRGKYPEALDELTAPGPTRYLRRLPRDPHDETRGYGYRVSPFPDGEWLRPSPTAPGQREVLVPVAPATPANPAGPAAPAVLDRFVPPGQAILWSSGFDKIPQGGTNPPVGGPAGFTRPLDLVYLVPAGPNP
jgi:hypothetical protein